MKFSFLLTVLLILPLIVTPFQAVDVKASPESMDWWDTRWKYRIPITFTNTLGEDLTDFQLNFTIDTATLISEGRMRDDCGDIRIVYNGKLLPYWIEPYSINYQYTKIWFKIDCIPAGGSVTVYMYYGNPSAASMAAPEEVFLFFDDFNGPTIDGEKWNDPEGDGNIEFETETIYGVTITYMKLSDTDGFQLLSKETFRGNIGIIARVKRFGSASDHDLYFYIWRDGHYHWGGTPGDYNYYRHRLRNCYDGNAVHEYGNRYIYDKWRTYCVSRYENTLCSVYPLYPLGSREVLRRSFTNILDEGHLAIMSDTDDPNRAHGIDWIAIRKYVSPLPDYTIGEEETYVYIIVKSASGDIFPGLTIEVYDGALLLSSGVSNSSGCALLGATLGSSTIKIKYHDHVLEEESISVSEAGENIEVSLDYDLVIITSTEVTRTEESPIPYLCMVIPLMLLGLRRRKSIQTWVAIVLAIIITIAIAVPIYVWVAHMTAPGEVFRPTKLAILDYSMPPNRIDLTLKNVGEYTDALHSITIKLGAETLRYYNSSTTVAVITPSGVTNVPLGNVKLKPGATYEIVIPFEWTAGYTYTIKILGKANSIVETELTP